MEGQAVTIAIQQSRWMLGAVGLEEAVREGFVENMGRDGSVLAKIVGKGIAGRSNGIEYQHMDTRVGWGVKNVQFSVDGGQHSRLGRNMGPDH